MKPLSERLKFGTPLHEHVLNAVRERRNMARTKLSNRFSQWRKNEDLFLAYAPPDAANNKRKTRWDSGQMEYHKVHIPYSYAVAMSAHTYWASVFLSRNPIMQYQARSGGPEMKVQPIEALVDYNVMRGAMLIPLYNWLFDPLKYGVGIVCNYYGKDTIFVADEVKVPKTWAGVAIPFTSKTEIQGKLLTSYEGNKLFNVRPYDFYPDPRVSLINFQEGEFCGRRASVSVNKLLSRGYSEGYGYFNLDRVREALGDGSYYDRGSSQLDMPDDPGDQLVHQRSKDFVSLTEMEITLIPSEWKVRDGRGEVVLWDSSYVQKWKFTIAGDYAVIGAEPMNLAHGKYSFHLQTYELDPYAFAPRGMMEIIEPLNKTMSWLLDSHMHNVRTVLNGQMMVDPSRVVMRDFEEGGAGRMVRLAPSAYGTDPKTVYSQMVMQDVTQTHLRDIQILEQIIQRVTGVSDNLQGLNSSGRKTATEVRSSNATGVNRLKVHAEICSAMGWQPLGSMLLSNLQQFYDEQKQMRIAGDLSPGGPTFADVSPDSIAGDFDWVPVDGTMPIDRLAQANLWKEMLATVASLPQIAGQYDIGGIFSFVAKLAGLKNIGQFKVAPDQALMQQAQAGNLVPVEPTKTPVAEVAQVPSGSVGGNGVRY